MLKDTEKTQKESAEEKRKKRWSAKKDTNYVKRMRYRTEKRKGGKWEINLKAGWERHWKRERAKKRKMCHHSRQQE